MRVKLLLVGKTDHPAIGALLEEYRKRLLHYISFETEIIPTTKAKSPLEQKAAEGPLILRKINPTDRVILLDELGKEASSVGFSDLLQRYMNTGTKRLVFVVGGAYGFSDEVKSRFRETLSLSKMTFSHQLVRLFFVEQLYRACTILKGEPYHH